MPVTPVLAPGITVNDGVRLTPVLVAYLNRLRAALPAAVPLHVNSGVRTPSEQADAMWTKYQEAEAKGTGGGAAELIATYGAKADALFQVAHTEWAALVEQAQADGTLFSRHLTGDALDVRTRDLTDSARADLIAAVKATGARPLYEGTPPHLHIDRIAAAALLTGPASTAPSASGGPGRYPKARSTLLLLLLIGTVGGSVGAALGDGEIRS